MFGHDQKLAVTLGLNNRVTGIKFDGVIYRSQDSSGQLFGNGSYRVMREGDLLRWRDKDGAWMRFDLTGKLLSFGHRSATVASLVYDGLNVSRFTNQAGDKTYLTLTYEQFTDSDSRQVRSRLVSARDWQNLFRRDYPQPGNCDRRARRRR